MLNSFIDAPDVTMSAIFDTLTFNISKLIYIMFVLEMESGQELAPLGLLKTKLCNRSKVVQDVAHCPWTVLLI